MGNNCCGQVFEVKGKLIYNGFFQSECVYSNRMDFRVVVDGCRWLISTLDQRAGFTATTAFEGGISYNLNTWVKGSSNIYAAIIEAEEVPSGNASAISYVWLAYASSCYFKNLKTNFIVPLRILDDPHLRDEGFKMEGRWSISSELPYLPLRVEYLNDGVVRAYDFKNKERVTFPYRDPYNKGHIDADYLVLEKTNIGGITLPAKFIFKTYALPPFVSTNDHPTNLMVRSEIEVSEVTVSLSPNLQSFRPQFSGMVNYTDKRISRPDGGVISVPRSMTNGQWPDVTPALIRTAGFFSQTKISTRQEPAKTKQRMVIVILFSVSLGLLSIIWWQRNENRTQK